MKSLTKLALILLGIGLLCLLSAWGLAGGNFSQFSQTGPLEMAHYQVASQDIRTITLSSSIANIEVISDDQEDIRLDYSQDQRLRYEIKQEGDQLSLEDRAPSNPLFWFNLWPSHDHTVILRLPRQVKADLSIRTTIGDQSIAQLHSQQSLSLSSTTGTIRLGDINIEGDLTLEQTTGKFQASRLQARNLNAHSTTGAIKIQTLELTGTELMAQTTVGNLDINEMNAIDQIDLSSTTGSIRGHIRGKKSDYRLDIKGEPISSSNQASPKSIKAHSTTGSVQITFDP